MGAQVASLVRLDLVSHVQALNFFEVVSVALTQSRQLVIGLTLLRLEALVGVLTHLHLVLHLLDVDVATADQLSLSVQLGVQLCVLTFAIVVN